MFALVRVVCRLVLWERHTARNGRALCSNNGLWFVPCTSHLLIWFVRRRHGSIARNAPMRVTSRYVLGETCGTWKVSQRPLFGGALGSSYYTATYDRMIVLWPRRDVPWLKFLSYRYWTVLFLLHSISLYLPPVVYRFCSNECLY